MTEHENYLQKALELARRSVQHGNHPFGALLVHEGQVVAEAENTVLVDKDPTQHAELRLVSQAARHLAPDVLAKATLYTSTEPCAMCAGAIYWTGVRRVVFGTSGKRLGELASGSFVVPSEGIFACGRETTELIGPLLADEADAIHAGFWGRT
jgi:tRNA(Arg) A34 adenosine deaminase TadA